MKILVAVFSPVAAWNIPPASVERLRLDFPHHTFEHARTEAEVLPLLGSSEIAFLAEMSPEQLAGAPALQWIHSPAAGVGGMLFPRMRESPIVISNSRGMSGVAIAEHVLALTLALFRKLPVVLRSQAARLWAQDEIFAHPRARTLAGSSALVIGLGGIGSATASRFAALGATVHGIRRSTDRPIPEGVATVSTPDQLLDRLPEADLVVLAAPQTATTRSMIGGRELEAMRHDAVLINVSRGKLVDERALAAALAAHAIGGAGLDVFEHEPLDPSSPLWTLPNVIITPHVSGFRADHWEAATGLFAENLRRFDAGEPLLNVVDKAAGY